MPDVDEIEIEGAVSEILGKYGNVIGQNQARNIAYTALVGARGAKCRARPAASGIQKVAARELKSVAETFGGKGTDEQSTREE